MKQGAASSVATLSATTAVPVAVPWARLMADMCEWDLTGSAGLAETCRGDRCRHEVGHFCDMATDARRLSMAFGKARMVLLLALLQSFSA